MEFILMKDKETKGTVRYSDEKNHNIYLKKEALKLIGNPEKLKIIVMPVKSSRLSKISIFSRCSDNLKRSFQVQKV